MALRLIEVVVPDTSNKELQTAIEEWPIIDCWHDESAGERGTVKVLVAVEQSEEVLDKLEQHYSHSEGFRVVLVHVEATLPRYEGEDEKQEDKEQAEQETGADQSAPEEESTEDEAQPAAPRISREELYLDLQDNIQFTSTYMALVALSAIVAAAGLIRNSAALVIGAMVIAPLLSPNVGLALATTLGDYQLGLKALRTNLAGLGLALGISIGIGLIFSVDPAVPEIAFRAQVNLSDIFVALASGSAGVLAYTSGVAIAIIGVMVAVALLPPLVAMGLLLGSGEWFLAFGAFLLVITNLICINLAGIVTFAVQGIRPRRWYEANKAERATRIALALWGGLLIVLAIAILVSQRYGLTDLSQ